MSKENAESLSRSSGKIGLATATSRVTGMVREMVFAYLLGSGLAADAYFAATRIPNLLRDLFAEGALGAAFVPVASEKLAHDQRGAAFGLLSRMIVVMSTVVGLAVICGIVLAPWLVDALAPGFGQIAGKSELTTSLVRWTFPYLWLISLAALVAGTLNALHRFGVPASAPILFNVGHIATAVIFYSVFDPPVTALAIGVVVGAGAQLLFQLPALRRAGFRFRPGHPWKDRDVRRVLRLMLPVALGLAALQLNNLATTLIASLLPQGSLSYLNYAFRLMHFPLGVFAVAVGTAVLPRASAAVARDDPAALRQTYNEGAQLAAFLVLPAAGFLVTFPAVLVQLIFERGAFTANDTIQVATALRWYALGLLGYTGVRVSAPMFYAHRDTRTPMKLAMISVAANVVLNLALARPLGFAGLALANALAGTLNFGLLQNRLRRAYALRPGKETRRTVVTLLLDTALACGVCAYLAYGLDLLDLAAGTGARLGIAVGLGLAFVAVYMWRALFAESPQRVLLARLLRKG